MRERSYWIIIIGKCMGHSRSFSVSRCHGVTVSRKIFQKFKTYLTLSLIFHGAVIFMPGINLPIKNKITPKEFKCKFIKIKPEPEETPPIKKIAKQDNFKLEKIMAQEVEICKPKENKTYNARPINEICAEDVKPSVKAKLIERQPLTHNSGLKDFRTPGLQKSLQSLIIYQNYIKSLIEQNKKYPSWARRNGYEGSVVLSFAVTSRGYIDNIKILESSGYDIFDKEALRTIKSISPVKLLPEDCYRNTMEMVVKILFCLK